MIKYKNRWLVAAYGCCHCALPKIMLLLMSLATGLPAAVYGGNRDSGAGMCPGKWITIGPKAVFREQPTVKSKKLYKSKTSRQYRIVTVRKNWLAVVDESGMIGWMNGKDIYALEPVVGGSSDLAGRQQMASDKQMYNVDKDDDKAAQGYQDGSIASKSAVGKKGLEVRLDANMGFFLENRDYPASTGKSFDTLLGAPALIIRGMVLKYLGKYGFGVDWEYYQTMLGKLEQKNVGDEYDWGATGTNLRAIAIYQLTPKFNLAARAGYRYDSFGVSDVDGVELPNETLSGVTVGASAIMPRLWDKVNVSAGLDWLLSGKLDQKEQAFQDGEIDKVAGLYAHLIAHYKWKSKIEWMASYTYFGETIEFLGETDARKDTQHLIGAGLTYRF